ncbi:MAG: DNA sulfur modification protein DndD [Anaerobacillus sp.]|uniref:DNA sulfur modification protein DndD n=1 Tax=Anaerobacillus sp. TaxID=1872506 RepID=UPI00391ACCE0
MQLTKITLVNIGAYRGINEIHLSIPSPDQNVILFGGENGAGKTTLLNSIRLALFGSFVYGYMTENDKYLKEVFGFLNKNAVKENDNRFQIILEFSEVENYKRNFYKFNRSWTLSKGVIKEQFNIIKNGDHLSDLDKETYHSKLKETMPPELFNMCLFDGEEISRIVNDNRLAEHLFSAAKVLFNLNMFENLETDLDQFMKHSNEQRELSGDEAKLLSLNEDLENLNTMLTTNNKTLNINENKIAGYKEKLTQLKKDFEVHGGLIKEERDHLLSQVNEIENNRKQNSDQVREFVSTLFPLYLNRDLLKKVKTQMNQEKTHEILDFLDNGLSDDKVSILLSKIEDTGAIKVNKREELQSQFKNEFLNLFSTENDHYIHRASFSQRSEIENIVSQVEKLSISAYRDKITNNQELLNVTSSLRKQIDTNDKTNDFKEILSEIDELNQNIIILEQKQNEIHEANLALNEKILGSEKESETLKQKLKASTKNKNAFIISSQIIDLSKRFRQQQLQKKIHEVQIQATKMLNSLMRKKDYVSSIHIDISNFNITLFNQTKDEIYKERLSSGEKEILLLSIVWAMFKSSGRRLPFIFDTLLGRLDKTHKNTVLTQLIPMCGEQVIILSTDTEIDPVHYNLITPRISKEYMLEFMIETEQVKIHNNYFNFNQVEVAK